MLSATIVAFYDTLGLPNFEFIWNETKLEVIAVSSEWLKNIMSLKKKGCLKSLANIILFDNITQD